MFEDNIRRLQKADLMTGVVYAIEGLASLHINQGQVERAAQLFAWAGIMHEKMDDYRSALEQASVDKDLTIIHSKIDDTEFTCLTEQGSTMNVEQAITLALEPVEKITEINLLSDTDRTSPVTLPSQREAEKHKYGGLTSREREVAAQIAQGKSNHAIAAELFVGLKTVEAHVSRILSKLGFISRAQVAGWAVGKGLAAAPQDLDTLAQKD